MGLFNRSDKSADAGTSTAVFDAPTSHLSDISGEYVIDASHSRIGFSARHAMVTTVRGSFGEFEGTAHVDTANPSASSAKVVIKTASIETGAPDRDGHLRSADFFDADANPEITFTTTRVERVEDDVWRLTGDLVIKGVSKSVAIDFESTGSAIDPFGNTRIGFEGSTSINRKDWGLTWNAALETGGVLVSEKIKLEFDVSAIKSA